MLVLGTEPCSPGKPLTHRSSTTTPTLTPCHTTCTAPSSPPSSPQTYLLCACLSNLHTLLQLLPHPVAPLKPAMVFDSRCPLEE